MKRLGVFIGVALGLSVACASDVRGIIEEIDDANKTIKVNNQIIKVMPYTEIEQEGCGSGWDTPKTFSQLRVNDVVEVDVFYDNGKMIAKEIEIGCGRAY
ncbi:DUF5666 domain-containing protein [Helicobacter brantae]|uniref:DUF5666 domain-containing protein n=1 Tax=Helicobacter brantae TaxID=375927 RepID=A0A3D8J0N5_9HELI|nr:DUF5666 domain-containing protein [Helicobacter brantae]RDU70770.1 hypothetical protein CQA58_04390 [Helicobacter brantae]